MTRRHPEPDEGLDALPEPEPDPVLPVYVLCPAGLHEVLIGDDCWECAHGCSNPDPACPGRG